MRNYNSIEHIKGTYICFISGDTLLSIEELPENYENKEDFLFDNEEIKKTCIDSYLIAKIQGFSFKGLIKKNSSLELFKILEFKYFDLNHKEIQISNLLKENLRKVGLDLPK